MNYSEEPMTAILDPHYMTDEDKERRAKAMYALYTDDNNPHSLEEVGLAFEGLSRERVRQIFREFGYPIRTRRGTRMLKRSKK